jgi:AcrR family transcriptional regulator
MTESPATPSPRKSELLELSYTYALTHGLGGLSLRPLAAAIGSSPRVLLFLFGSKDGLIRDLLGRARADELALLDRLQPGQTDSDLADATVLVWEWLSDRRRRGLLTLWVEAYALSLVDPAGPWAGFARQTVTDWLDVLARYQPASTRATAGAVAQRTAALALLRGTLLDLLATGDQQRTTAAIRHQLNTPGSSLQQGPSKRTRSGPNDHRG